MDTETTPEQMAAFVAQQIDVIKRHMPETYRSIKERSADTDLGRKAFELVRRGIRGEYNCFYAVEGGHVVGSPFNKPDITGPIAVTILKFGCGFLVIWPEPHPPLARVLAQEQRGA